jgi:hypothetical protein
MSLKVRYIEIMATFLKAVPERLKDIEDAVETKNRRYQCTSWLEEASKAIDPTWENSSNSYAKGICLGTWNRFRGGKVRISKQAFIAYCSILKLNWQEIAGIGQKSYPYGFKSRPEKRIIFNSYAGERVIHNLWTDPLWYKNGGYKHIKPYIKPEVISTLLDGSFLRLEFIRQGWGVNATIRPENDIPVDTSSFQSMKIKFKSPNRQLVGLRVRIIDINCVHWGYGENLAYENQNLSTDSNTWQEVIIPLAQNHWFHFPYDGYPPKEGQKHPDFDSLSLISFEVGLEGTGESLATITKLKVNNAEPAMIDIKPVEFI